jgi:hypothetical protein
MLKPYLQLPPGLHTVILLIKWLDQCVTRAKNVVALITRRPSLFQISIQLQAPPFHLRRWLLYTPGAHHTALRLYGPPLWFDFGGIWKLFEPAAFLQLLRGGRLCSRANQEHKRLEEDGDRIF